MLNWNSSYNWTKLETERAVNNAIKERRGIVGLDTEHTDYQNELDMKRWVEEMGYSAKIQMDRIVVKLTK